jgi:phage-related protein
VAGNLNDYFTTVVGRDVNPSIGFRKAAKAKVLTAQFGDGYSQRTAYGLNYMPMEWSVSYVNQSLETAEAIVDFISKAGTTVYTGIYPDATIVSAGDPTAMGVEYFYWTPPGETTAYKVICSEYDVEYTSHFSRTINCKFTQVFDL